MTDAEQRVLELEAELAEQKAKTEKALVIKVSPKGCVQINGIRKFPVTYYKNEWEVIFGLQERIEQFIIDHDSELATK
jgi:hypothetical protein